MQTVLHVNLASVYEALAKLGLDEGVLLDAVQAGYLARANCTANHPPLFPSFVAWGEAVRILRDGLAPLGWVRSNERNWPRTVSPDGLIAITVATGNDATGRSTESPTTTSSKGPSTVDALEVNRLQFSLPGMEPIEPEVDEGDENKPATWLLLVHHGKTEIRSELSLPLDVDREGRVSVWRERIILRAIPLDGESIEITPPAQPDIDIAVRRKA
jgi:hypothetical protein